VRVVAVDWSGRVAGARRAIWLAEAVDGRVTRLECGRSRDDVVDHLLALAAADHKLAVGLDFSFSLPAWFLHERGCATADALWAAAAVEGDAWLASSAPPFWGRPGRSRPSMPEPFRATERALPSVGGVRPKSTFQIGGAGSVGTGAVRGFPALARLRAGGFRIWPFHDEPALPVVVEIYPRLCTGPVVKSRVDARRAHCRAAFSHVDDALVAHAIDCEDAFDALAAVVVMDRHARELGALPRLDDPVRRVEGEVWAPVEARPGDRVGARP
jgi:hypothetical protein